MVETLKAVFDHPTSVTLLLLGILLLVGAIVGEIPKQVHLSVGKRTALAVLGSAVAIIGLIAGWPSQASKSLLATSTATYMIAKINGAPLNPHQTYETDFKVELEGYLTAPAVNGYIIVKPDNDNLWYVQQPAPVDHVGQNGMQWQGAAYLGHQNGAGIGDSFTIFIVATTDNYHGQNSLNSEPQGMKSEIVRCKRVR